MQRCEYSRLRESKLIHHTSADELHRFSSLYQVGALKVFLDEAGLPLNHIKPHGMWASLSRLFITTYPDPLADWVRCNDALHSTS